MTARRPSLGIFFARPDRGAYLAERLRARGFDVTSYRNGDEPAPGVPVPWRLDAALARLLVTDHDAYYTALCFLPALCLWANRRLRGKPYVFNLTGAKWETFREAARARPLSAAFERRLYPWLLERTFAGASRIVCNSRFLERRVGALYPRHRGRLTTIYNGIERERFAGGRRRRLPGAGGRDAVLLTVTSLAYAGKARGLALVLEAFGTVWARTPNVHLVVAVNTTGASQADELERALATRPWRGQTTILVNCRFVPDLLASADLFLYATPDDSNDSLPRALLEAQAAGVPVVTTATSGCPEVVRHGVTGLTVPYAPSALAESALALVEDPGERRRMADLAPELLAERFDWDVMADRYAEIFHEVVGRPAEAAA